MPGPLERNSPLLPALLALVLGAGLLACQEGRDYVRTVVTAQGRAEGMQMRASFHALASALQAYQLDQGHYPDRLADLPEVASGRLRADDPWGAPLRYRSEGGGYEVRSPGPDGRPDTEDDILLRDGQVE